MEGASLEVDIVYGEGFVPGTCNDGGVVINVRGGLGGLFGEEKETDAHRKASRRPKGG